MDHGATVVDHNMCVFHQVVEVGQILPSGFVHDMCYQLVEPGFFTLSGHLNVAMIIDHLLLLLGMKMERIFFPCFPRENKNEILQNEIGIFFFATNRTAFSGKTDMKIAFRF
jgi:hypothetical protein